MLPAVRIHFVRLLHGRRVCRLAPQAVTSAVIGGAGDLTCQCAFENRDIEAIDLRLADRVTVKLTEAAYERREDAIEERAKAIKAAERRT